MFSTADNVPVDIACDNVGYVSSDIGHNTGDDAVNHVSYRASNVRCFDNNIPCTASEITCNTDNMHCDAIDDMYKTCDAMHCDAINDTYITCDAIDDMFKKPNPCGQGGEGARIPEISGHISARIRTTERKDIGEFMVENPRTERADGTGETGNSRGAAGKVREDSAQITTASSRKGTGDLIGGYQEVSKPHKVAVKGGGVTPISRGEAARCESEFKGISARGAYPPSREGGGREDRGEAGHVGRAFTDALIRGDDTDYMKGGASGAERAGTAPPPRSPHPPPHTHTHPGRVL